MKDKKRMIILAGTGIVLLLAIIIALPLILNNSKNNIEYREIRAQEGLVNAPNEEIGIHYGGHFDEFAPPDDSKQNWEKQNAIASEPEISDWTEPLKSPAEILAEDDNSNPLYNGMISDTQTAVLDLNNFLSDEKQKELSDEKEDAEVDVSDLGIPIFENHGYFPNEVLCDAETEEQAREIASQISGKLLSWSEGTGVIQIEVSVDELLTQLEQQGSNLVLHKHYRFE